ncbi:RNA recognition motif-containing protein RRM [Heterostelium album PN500]|uniref:RNA recognition motif-containing protein RRM n=1 Tax=Heterostelium pallidum (strain ATCC 26659 / Pp 5 / PN500) TaxID=670386 RepID=D3BEK7_HETP5|nr:RNA recognition motif-containing protein RRM [Heterostelium album PN500]EFA80338.1 RNA recognition motif-containing protein RRM [Heterostelium album PN500]|eukprot:XP_020432458.1 RNA recognition motif-containing protein RRM [Heterostelium album PN500]
MDVNQLNSKLTTTTTTTNNNNNNNFKTNNSNNNNLGQSTDSLDSILSSPGGSSSTQQSTSPDLLEKDQTNVFVKYLPNEYGDYELFTLFSPFGKVMSAKVMVDAKGNSYGYGFVRFSSPSESKKAIDNMDGFQLMHKKLLCRLSNLYSNCNNKYPSNNLFLKPLPATLSDDQLKELFSPFGEILECKVMIDQNGNSKLAGFVRFCNEADATKAMQAMNGTKMKDSPAPLVVKYADNEHQKSLRKQRKYSHFINPHPVNPYYNYVDHYLYFQVPQYYSFQDPNAPPIPIYPGQPNIYNTYYGTIPQYYHAPSSPESHLIGSPTSTTSTAPMNQGHHPAPLPNPSSPLFINQPSSPRSPPTVGLNTSMNQYTIPAPNSPTSNSKKSKQPHHHQQQQQQQHHHNKESSIAASASNASPPYSPPITSTSSSSSSTLNTPISNTPKRNTTSPTHHNQTPHNTHNQSSSSSTSYKNLNTSNTNVSPPPLINNSNSTSTTTTQSNVNNNSNDTNLFVFHLPGFVDDSYLYKLFSRFGPLQSVRVITDKDTGENKGYGFVKFQNKDDAITSLNEMNGLQVGQKYLKVKLKDKSTPPMPLLSTPSTTTTTTTTTTTNTRQQHHNNNHNHNHNHQQHNVTSNEKRQLHHH